MNTIHIYKIKVESDKPGTTPYEQHFVRLPSQWELAESIRVRSKEYRADAEAAAESGDLIDSDIASDNETAMSLLVEVALRSTQLLHAVNNYEVNVAGVRVGKITVEVLEARCPDNPVLIGMGISFVVPTVKTDVGYDGRAEELRSLQLKQVGPRHGRE